ncbi:uncharacterized protein LOC113346236 [Papaver somniferum]|uniref:uncharacterized protein LOC113346236 n=1 Tax=Papaver somniferum TaxID=3469 RepID=UPI000E7029FA|nr:uncharacterized protein LOC113346236 [Papaver somniferum]
MGGNEDDGDDNEEDEEDVDKDGDNEDEEAEDESDEEEVEQEEVKKKPSKAAKKPCARYAYIPDDDLCLPPRTQLMDHNNVVRVLKRQKNKIWNIENECDEVRLAISDKEECEFRRSAKEPDEGDEHNPFNKDRTSKKTLKKIKMTTLFDEFSGTSKLVLEGNLVMTEEKIKHHVTAYLLYQLGTIFFPDTSGHVDKNKEQKVKLYDLTVEDVVFHPYTLNEDEEEEDVDVIDFSLVAGNNGPLFYPGGCTILPDSYDEPNAADPGYIQWYENFSHPRVINKVQQARAEKEKAKEVEKQAQNIMKNTSTCGDEALVLWNAAVKSGAKLMKKLMAKIRTGDPMDTREQTNLYNQMTMVFSPNNVDPMSVKMSCQEGFESNGSTTKQWRGHS